MRVISVPGRLVRHPVTHRVIDEAGVLIDPHDLTWVNLIADGDVELVEDEAVTAEAAPAQIALVEDVVEAPETPPAHEQE